MLVDSLENVYLPYTNEVVGCYDTTNMLSVIFLGKNFVILFKKTNTCKSVISVGSCERTIIPPLARQVTNFCYYE